MEENLDEFDYMIINVESCLNGSIDKLNVINENILCGSGYSALRLTEELSTDGVEYRIVVIPNGLLFESWKSGQRINYIQLASF